MSDVEDMLKAQEGTGVYRIVNLVTNTTYIGSSVKVRRRLCEHKRHLATSKHRNKYLQRSWEKYGQDVFSFESLIACDRGSLAQREQQFIDAYFDHDLALYNLKPSSESQHGFSQSHSQESRANMSAAHLGHKPSAETRLKMSAAHKGNKHGLGYRHTEEARTKISASGRGNQWNIGKKHPPETIEKMRAAQTARRKREALC